MKQLHKISMAQYRTQAQAAESMMLAYRQRLIDGAAIAAITGERSLLRIEAALVGM